MKLVETTIRLSLWDNGIVRTAYIIPLIYKNAEHGRNDHAFLVFKKSNKLNALKSIFASIRSDKAVGEIEKLGVATKRVAENGKKEWRSVEEILLDLAIATQETEKATDKAFQAIAGGKWQWNKLAALVGDYKEIIKVWQMSIGSTGFTEDQLSAQLDTIARKAAQVKSAFEGLVMSSSTGGIGKEIKDWLDSVNSFINGLRQIPTETWTVLESGAKLIIIVNTINMGLKLLQKSITSFTMLQNAASLANTNNTASLIVNGNAIKINTENMVANAASKTANTAITNTLTAANRGLATVTTLASGGLNVLTLALIAGSAYAAYHATQVGAIATAAENAAQKQKDLIAVNQQKIDTSKREIEFIDTLVSAHSKLSEALNKVGSDTKKADKLKKDMIYTEEVLTEVTGKSTDEIIKNGEINKDVINSVKEAKKKQVDSMVTDLRRILKAQAETVEKQIKNTEKRIKDMEREAKGLGILAQAYRSYYNFMANFSRGMASWAEKGGLDGVIKDKFGFDPNKPLLDWRNDKIKAVQDKKIQDATNAMVGHYKGLEKEYEKASQNIVDNALAPLYDKLAGLQGDLGQTYSNLVGDFTNDPPGGNTVDSNGKNNGSGSNNKEKTIPTPPKLNLYKDYKNKFDEQKKKFLEEYNDKLEEYSTLLEEVSRKEELHGITSETTSQKLEILNTKQNFLINTQGKLSNKLTNTQGLRSNYQAELDAIIKYTQENEGKYTSMSEQSKKAYKEKIDKGNKLIEVIKFLAGVEEDYTQKIKDNSKAMLDNNYAMNRNKIENIYNELNFSISHRSANAEIDAAQLNRHNPLRDLEEKAIRLKEAIGRLSDEEWKLNQMMIDQKPREEIDAQRVKVAQLKSEVEKLNDKWEDVRKFWADSFIDMAQNGATFGDIMKKMFNDLAKDAIYALFRVQHQASITSQMVGMGKGKGGGGKPANVPFYTPTTLAPPTHHNGAIVKSFPKMHSGGVIPYLKNDEVIRTLQTGEEVVSRSDRTTNAQLIELVGKLSENQQQQQPVIIQISAVDAKSVAELFNNNSDILTQVLRKEKAMGNGI